MAVAPFTCDVGEGTRRLQSAMLSIVCVAIAIACVLAAPVAAHADQATRTLLLTDRFKPSSAPSSNVLASQMVSLKGESQGFQLAIQGTGGRLHAAVSAAQSSSLLVQQTSFLRVGYVNVTVPSTHISLGSGVYADPLPRQTGVGLGTSSGLWGGWVVLVNVPRATAAGMHQGVIEITDDNGTVVASVPFSVRVSSVSSLERKDKRAFKMYAGFQADWYRSFAPVGHDNLRTQFLNVHAFLADRGITPTAYPFTDPSPGGRYTSQGANQMNQYMSMPWTVNVVPYTTGNFSLRRNMGSKGKNYLRGINSAWSKKGWKGKHSIMHIWDEPSPAHERGPIPKMNTLVHKNMPGVKTLVTTPPKEKSSRSSYTNKHLWDGGKNDIDIWSIPPHRFYGRWTSKGEKSRGINNERVVWKRLQKIKKRGKQVWSNTYLMPTKKIPQLVIDGQPTDTRLLMMWNAMEQNSGWSVWQMNRWIGGNNERKRNPFNDTVSFITPVGERGNGDVSLIYPPVNAAYDLHDTAAAPISSLRLESLRIGMQDVNLVTLYRKRFGPSATDKLFKGIFGKLEVVKGTGFVWPTYSNRNMSARMETMRRTMIVKLES